MPREKLRFIRASPKDGTRSLDRDCQINRSCKPANPAFTMSKNFEDECTHEARWGLNCCTCPICFSRRLLSQIRSRKRHQLRLHPLGFGTNSPRTKAGGANRDRTGDLKLAKLALSQLSYGPGFARSGYRRLACQPQLREFHQSA